MTTTRKTCWYKTMNLIGCATHPNDGRKHQLHIEKKTRGQPTHKYSQNVQTQKLINGFPLSSDKKLRVSYDRAGVPLSVCLRKGSVGWDSNFAHIEDSFILRSPVRILTVTDRTFLWRLVFTQFHFLRIHRIPSWTQTDSVNPRNSTTED